MVTFTIGGVSATPMALTDEKGNSVIFETITNQWTEELARSVTMSCGGSVTCSLYVMDGKTMKAYSVHDIVTRSEQLGKAIRNVKNATEGTPEENFLAFSEASACSRAKFPTYCAPPTASSTWAGCSSRASASAREDMRK